MTDKSILNSEILLSIKLQQQLFVDPKRIRLLKEIHECGSINQAAKNANVSYKSAWDHLQAMHDISPKPLLTRNTGGKHGGGTQLTPYAERLLQLYDLLEQTQEKAFQILHDESIPLNSLLSATARFSPQSSARNQFFGKVKHIFDKQINCLIEIEIPALPKPLYALITKKSAVRLQLVLGKEVMAMIKAPWIKILPQNTDAHFDKLKYEQQNYFPAQITSVLDNGNIKEVTLRAEKEANKSTDEELEFCTTVTKEQNIVVSQSVWIHIEPEQIILLALQ